MGFYGLARAFAKFSMRSADACEDGLGFARSFGEFHVVVYGGLRGFIGLVPVDDTSTPFRVDRSADENLPLQLANCQPIQEATQRPNSVERKENLGIALFASHIFRVELGLPDFQCLNSCFFRTFLGIVGSR